MFLTFIFCCPFYVNASVLISEVAWMGDADNPNAEWIELYNNGEQVNLSGWTLKALDGQPDIALDGVLPANSYALLERSTDDTVSSVPAFVVYTGSLSNSGEVLELRDANGVLVDSVDGSNSWSVGGDNETKKTLQRAGNPPTGGWITATRNPNGVAPQTENETGDVNDDNANEDSDNTDITSVKEKISGGGSIIYGSTGDFEDDFKYIPAVKVKIESLKTITLGSPAKFTAKTYKENGEEFLAKNVKWNFGDGFVATGREVEHVFPYVGDYLVSVVASRGGFLEEIKDKETVVVHVVNPLLKITHADFKYVELQNDNNKNIDLSDFVLVSGGVHFKIPEDTFMLANSSLRFSSKVTGLKSKTVSLFNPNGTLVSKYEEIKKNKITPVSVSRHKNISKSFATKSVKAGRKDDFVATTSNEVVVNKNNVNTANVIEAYGGTKERDENFWWWVLALIVSIFVVIVVVLLVRQEEEEIIEGFIIESDD